MRIKRTLVASAVVVSLFGVGACGVNKDEDKPKDCATNSAMSNSNIEMDPVGYVTRPSGGTSGVSRPAPAPAPAKPAPAPAPAKPAPAPAPAKPAEPVKPAKPAKPVKPKHDDFDLEEEIPQEETSGEDYSGENSGGTTGGVPTPTSTCEGDENN
jgi:hypothetical protein